jgi:iron complex outermembrane receptor protein
MSMVGSVRHDHYSDFGSTTNYKVGLSYAPIEMLTLRGNYSTSFNAPSPVDQLGSLLNTISFFPFNAFVRPGDTPAATGTLALQGSQANLVPQTAKTYSVGADIDPIYGLHGTVNYYHVAFSDILGIPTPNSGIFSDFPNNVTTNVNGVSAAQLQAFAQLAPNGSSVVSPLVAANYPVYELVEFLKGNYGELNVSGLDFATTFRHDTGFGAVDASVAGNFTLDRTSKISSTSPVVNVLDFDTSRLQLTASIGADFGHLRAQTTLNHSSGFNVQRSAALPQDHVSDFNTVNLFFKYDVRGTGPLLANLAFTFNVNNVFDTAPPLYKLSSSNGYLNGFSVGRLYMFGFSEKL